MKLASVTLTHDRLHSLQECVNSIRRGSPDQIIVVDNASTDGTHEWLGMHPDILSVRVPHNDLGVVARNYGFAVVEDDIEMVVQIDDDVVMSSGWTDIMSTALSNPSVIATGQAGGYVGDFTSLLPAHVPPGTVVDQVTGFAWAIHKAKFPRESVAEPGRHVTWVDVRYPWEFAPRWHEEADLACFLRYHTGLEIMTCSPCAEHRSLAGPVNWQIHDEKLALLRHHWLGKITSAKDRV